MSIRRSAGSARPVHDRSRRIPARGPARSKVSRIRRSAKSPVWRGRRRTPVRAPATFVHNTGAIRTHQYAGKLSHVSTRPGAKRPSNLVTSVPYVPGSYVCNIGRIATSNTAQHRAVWATARPRLLADRERSEALGSRRGGPHGLEQCPLGRPPSHPCRPARGLRGV